jgi:hypothetical protein
MKPVVVPVGDGAMDYIDYGFALHGKGKRGKFSVADAVIITIDEKTIKILMLPGTCAITQRNGSFDGDFFVTFADPVPQVMPAMAGATQPVLPTYYPVYPNNLMVPLNDRVQIYDNGESADPDEYLFQAPITSYYGEYLGWNGVLLQYNGDDDKWLFLKYHLAGHLNSYDNPMRSKIAIYDSEITSEGDINYPNTVAAVLTILDGIQYRRLRGAAGDTIAVWLNDGANSGTLYAASEVDGAMSFDNLPLPPLPAGSSTSTEQIQYVYDIFTSERALNYYVIKLKVDIGLMYRLNPSHPYPNDVTFYPGMSAVVEKRSKSDFTLVDTFNLTPSAVDQILQGASVAAQVSNIANEQAAGATTGPDNITRFVPFAGTVLVDQSGNEYPILPILSCTQDYFLDTTYGFASRQAYLSAGTVRDTLKRNVFQQAGLLWLTKSPGVVDGYTWPGVDALGLKITEASGGLVNDVPLGAMAKVSAIIGDSDSALLQAVPFASGAYFQQIASAGGTATFQCRNCYEPTVAAGDVFHLSLNGVDVSHTVSSADMTGSDSVEQDQIVAGILEAVNATSSFTAALVGAGYDSDGYYSTFTVSTAPVSGVAPTLVADSSVAHGAYGQSNRQRILSVRLSGGEPVLRLERVQSTSANIYLYDV